MPISSVDLYGIMNHMILEGKVVPLTSAILQEHVMDKIETVQVLRKLNDITILVADLNVRHIDMADRCHIPRQEVASAGSIGYVGDPSEAIYYSFGGNSLVREGETFQEDPVQTQVTIDLLEGLLKKIGVTGVYLMPRSR